MTNLFKKILFKSPPKTIVPEKPQNPWVKEGEYIYLNSGKGLYQVTSVSKDGFYVIKENGGKNQTPKFHIWDDFKRWSSRSPVKQDQ